MLVWMPALWTNVVEVIKAYGMPAFNNDILFHPLLQRRAWRRCLWLQCNGCVETAVPGNGVTVVRVWVIWTSLKYLLINEWWNRSSIWQTICTKFRSCLNMKSFDELKLPGITNITVFDTYGSVIVENGPCSWKRYQISCVLLWQMTVYWSGKTP